MQLIFMLTEVHFPYLHTKFYFLFKMHNQTHNFGRCYLFI
jgi:hypothetical protein